MTWYAAHIVMAVHLQQPQTEFPVWENIVLVSASSQEEAFRKAEAYARSQEGDDDGSFRWNGLPATWVFSGVRKLTECPLLGEQPEDGSEITCNELLLDSKASLARFAKGDPVSAQFRDRFGSEQAGRAKTARRKRA